jgi:hypothetical protein
MTATYLIRPVLIAVLAAGFLWQAAHSVSRNDLFGVTATLEPTHLELRVKLPAICLRLSATVEGLLDASAQLLSCDFCDAHKRTRRWT